VATAASELLDDRSLIRARVLLTGTLMTPDGALQVRIRDISTAGAQIWAERPIEAGWDVVFKRGDLFVAAKVVWSYEQRAGLSFYREIDLDDVIAITTPAPGNQLASTHALA
jgi:PilZ domain